jgi:hypothetical protein
MLTSAVSSPWVRATLAALVLALAPLQGARAAALDVLVGGSSLLSGNGLLHFSDFALIATGSVSSDLTLYDVEALADGIAITGPISAEDGASGDFFLQFTVSSSQPIVGASLAFEGSASRRGSSASVVETFDEAPDAQMFVFVTGAGSHTPGDSVELDGFASLRVSKDVLVDAAKCEGSAAIERIEQRFQTEAPEPAALGLVGAALLGLVASRARRGPGGRA